MTSSTFSFHWQLVASNEISGSSDGSPTNSIRSAIVSLLFFRAHQRSSTLAAHDRESDNYQE
jgi:hypothetical protein